MDFMVDIPTPDGVCDSFVARPDGEGPFPAILHYMDWSGLRPAMFDRARALADQGYFVLTPNLFYRAGRAPVVPLDAVTAPESMPRLFELMGSLTPDVVLKDASVFLDYLERQPGVAGKAGIVGYCLSGSMALRIAAEFSDRIGAAASIHGSFLATEQADSPHLLVPSIECPLHIALAEEDMVMPPDQVERLGLALAAVGREGELESYPGTVHGFALPDMPTHHQEGDERHWRRVLDLFAKGLAQ